MLGTRLIPSADADGTDQGPLLPRRLDRHRRRAEGGGAAKRINGQVVCNVVDAGAGVLASYFQLDLTAIMSPAVRNTDHARHNVVRYFDGQLNRSRSRSHQD